HLRQRAVHRGPRRLPHLAGVHAGPDRLGPQRAGRVARLRGGGGSPDGGAGRGPRRLTMPAPHLLFVTGQLAEPALRRTPRELAPRAGFSYDVAVLPITVAALAPAAWVADHLALPASATPFQRVILPGLCAGDLEAVARRAGCPAERGPKDLRDLPEFFGKQGGRPPDYGAHDIAILADPHHPPRPPPP